MGNRRSSLALAAFTMLSACALDPPDPRVSMRYEKGLDSSKLSEIVSRAAPGDVAVVNLGNTAWVSHHVAVVRTEEKPHYHRFHDMTVVVLRGEGILHLEQRRIAMKAGDIAHVHRGTPHFFRSTGGDPSAAFVVFSPPFDGRDTVSAETKDEPPAPAPAKKKSWWKIW